MTKETPKSNAQTSEKLQGSVPEIVNVKATGLAKRVTFTEGSVEVWPVENEDKVPGVRVRLRRNPSGFETNFLLSMNGASALATLLALELNAQP